MKIYKQIKDDIVAALKNKNKVVLTTLRTLDAAVQQIVKDSGVEITDDLVMSCAKKGIKDRETTRSYAVQGKRPDLIEKCDTEIAILGKCLPQTLSLEDTERAVLNTIAELGAKTRGDMGKVMGTLKKKYGDGLDMSITSKLVNSQLS
jgi:uncharacterized protein